MPHLIELPNVPADLIAVLEGLEGAHEAIVAAARAWPSAELPGESWGVSAKRSLVELANLHPWIGVQSQPFSELVNQLATVERLIDVLRWAESAEFNTVLACHPTTSSGDHDLVARRGDGSLGVFEVSDVAGDTGNANQKMTSDLGLLINCTCPYCDDGAAKYVATSRVSGDWLSRLVPRPGRMEALGVAGLLPVAETESGTVITQLNHCRGRGTEAPGRGAEVSAVGDLGRLLQPGSVQST